MKSPAFQYYPRDLLADAVVSMMSAEEFGAYWLLVSHAWAPPPCTDGRQLEPGFLPDEDPILAKLARVSLRRWRDLRPSVMRAFKSAGDGSIYQKRLVEESEKQRDYAASASKAGKASGAARRAKAALKGTTPAVAVPLNGQVNGIERPFDSVAIPLNGQRTETNTASASASASAFVLPTEELAAGAAVPLAIPLVEPSPATTDTPGYEGDVHSDVPPPAPPATAAPAAKPKRPPRPKAPAAPAVPEPEKAPLPFPLAAMLAALRESSDGWILVEPFRPELVGRLTDVVRALEAAGYGLEDVRAGGRFAATTWPTWKSSTPSSRPLGWVATVGNLVDLIAQARAAASPRLALTPQFRGGSAPPSKFTKSGVQNG